MGLFRKVLARIYPPCTPKRTHQSLPVAPPHATEAFELLANWLDNRQLEARVKLGKTSTKPEEQHAKLVESVASCLFAMREVKPLMGQFYAVDVFTQIPGLASAKMRTQPKMVVFLNPESQPTLSSDHWLTFAPAVPIGLCLQQIWLHANDAGARVVLLFPERGFTSKVPDYWTEESPPRIGKESYTVVSIDLAGSIVGCRLSASLHGMSTLLKMELGIPADKPAISTTGPSKQIGRIIKFPGSEEWFTRKILNLPSYLEEMTNAYIRRL